MGVAWSVTEQVRSDFAAILDELDFVKLQLSWLPTRKECGAMLLAVTPGAGLVQCLAWLFRP